jgi:cytidylate kinase
MTPDALAALARARPPRCGRARLVCVDGPSGSGKTTLAGRLAPLLGAAVLHMDDLYPGWDGLAASVGLLHEQVVVPLAAGRPARWRGWDWAAERPGEVHELGVPGALVVEGAGCGSRVVAAHASLLVWVEAPSDVRRARGLARDGEAYRPHWERWAAQERALFAEERTRERADVVIAT